MCRALTSRRKQSSTRGGSTLTRTRNSRSPAQRSSRSKTKRLISTFRWRPSSISTLWTTISRKPCEFCAQTASSSARHPIASVYSPGHAPESTALEPVPRPRVFDRRSSKQLLGRYFGQVELLGQSLRSKRRTAAPKLARTRSCLSTWPCEPIRLRSSRASRYDKVEHHDGGRARRSPRTGVLSSPCARTRRKPC